LKKQRLGFATGKVAEVEKDYVDVEGYRPRTPPSVQAEVVPEAEIEMEVPESIVY
jgi:hypothetical protein